MTILPLIEELQELEKKATKGPWKVMEKPEASYGDHGWRTVVEKGNMIIAGEKEKYLRVERGEHSGIVKRKKEDTQYELELLAELRNAFPEIATAFIEQDRKLREAVATLQEIAGYDESGVPSYLPVELSQKALKSILPLNS